MYNLTNLTSSENIVDLAEFSNEVTGGQFFGFVMVGIFFIMLLMFRKWDFENSIMTSGFICFLLSSFLVAAKLISFIYPLVFLILTGLTVLYAYTTKRK